MPSHKKDILFIGEQCYKIVKEEEIAKKEIICILVCMLMIVSIIVPVSGTTVSEKTSQTLTMGNILYVGGLGPNNYSKIQDAIDNASDGDTVFVYNGIYSDNIHLACVNIIKQISLIGEDKYNTIIDGKEDPLWIITIRASYVNISGFTIKGAGGGQGIYISNSSSSAFRNITIHDNIIQNNDDGLFIRDTIDSVFYSNIILNNTGAGIYVEGNFGNCTIHNNTISNNLAGIAIYSTFGENIIEHNSIRNNKIGISFSLSTGTIRCNNLIKNTHSVRSFERVLVYFVEEDPSLLDRNITWDNNYWGAWKTSLPRPICSLTIIVEFHDKTFAPINKKIIPITNPLGILGWYTIVGVHRSIQFDRHPAQEPYDIPEMR